MANRTVRFRPLVIDGVGDPGIGRGIIRIRSLRRVPWGEVGELQSGAAGQLLVKVNGAAVTADLPVINAGDQNCLIVDSFIGPDASYPSRPSSTDFVLNPTGAGTVDAEDLPRVDPQTLGPVVVPAPSGLQAQVDQLLADVAALKAGQVTAGQVKVDDLGQLTEPGKTALKVTGADAGAQKLAFRTAIGAGTSSVTVGDQTGQAADGAAFKTLQAAVGEKASASSVSALADRVTAVEQEVDDLDLSAVVTDTDLQQGLATRARLDQSGQVITGTSGAGLVLATQQFVEDKIAEALAQNPSVPDDIQAQLDRKVDKTVMSNVQYTLIIPLGETGPSTRPAEAGNRPILQKGGPMPLPWIDRDKGDDWLGVLNA